MTDLEIIAFLESNRDTHTQWAELFEANPDAESKHVATGEWNSAAEHRIIERNYNIAIDRFKELI